MFQNFSWTDFSNGLWLIIIGLISGLGGVIGYRKSQTEVKAPPTVVQATLMDDKILERMVAAFEAMVRMLNSTAEIINKNSDVIHENSEVTKANNRALRESLELSERAVKDIRDLTIELERNRK